MTRRYRPTSIPVSHEDTQRAEFERERERPKPPPEPSVWEAKPEPEPAKLPPHGKPPKRTYIVVPPEDGSVVLPPSEARAMKRMFDQAVKTTTDPEVRKKLRAARAEVDQRTTRPKI